MQGMWIVDDLRTAYIHAKAQSERRLNAIIFSGVVLAGMLAGILLARVLG